MCGNFGIAGYGIIKDDLDVFQQLGIASQLRGLDGAGMYEVNTRWAVPHGTPEKLYKTEEDFNYLRWGWITPGKMTNSPAGKNAACDLLMGHVRAATTGHITAENAQPIQKGNIVGCHNGVVKKWEYQDHTKTLSDSNLMFEDIAERGLPAVLEDLDDSLDAYAIVMYDKKSNLLYSANNGKRPLAFAVNQKRRVLYWASEADMLRWVLRRNKIEFEDWEVDDKGEKKKVGGIWRLNEGAIWSCKIEDIAPRKNIFKKVHVIYYVDPANGRKFRLNHEKVEKKETKGVEVKIIKKEDDADVVPFRPPYRHVPNVPLKGRNLNKECGTCGEELTPVQQWKIRTGKIENTYYDQATNKYYCNCEKAAILLPPPKEQTN